MSTPTAGEQGEAPIAAAEATTLFSGLAQEPLLLVAVSGGPDSVALLALLHDWAREPGRPVLHATTVDHGLREDAATEAVAVAALCADLGIPHAILRWQATRIVSAIQEQARQARYDLLAAYAKKLGGAVLITAHTLDDQAETLLMRMAHGSGPAGLAGMKARTSIGGVMLARPLLSVPKARLVATAKARGLGFVTDPSNADCRFERARWRSLMPALAAQGLSAQRLATLADRMARLDEAVAHRVAILLPAVLDLSDGAVSLRFASLLDEPDEIALRVVAAALDAASMAENDGHLRLERLESCVFALLDACRAGTAMTRTLSGCVLSLRRDGVLTLKREPPRKRGVHFGP